MKNFKIVIEYDGSRYNGWQKQGNTQNTIQYKFEQILHKLFNKTIEINSSGRTDSGVHAKGQTANFKCGTNLSAIEIMNYINEYLPEDIRVLSCTEADERFHSRLSAVKKTYSYRIYCKDKPPVFERKYLYAKACNPDIALMTKASEYLLGEHDFKSFCTKQNLKKSTKRKIYDIKIIKKSDLLEIIITGNGFLYNMVRIIAGTLLDVGTGNIPPEDIKNILKALNREYAGPTLPPCGLTLLDVEY